MDKNTLMLVHIHTECGRKKKREHKRGREKELNAKYTEQNNEMFLVRLKTLSIVRAIIYYFIAKLSLSRIRGHGGKPPL